MTTNKKFRFFDKKLQKYISQNGFLTLPFDNDEYIVEQHLRKRDINDKEVYEGDILRLDQKFDFYLYENNYSLYGHIWIPDMMYGAGLSFNHPYSETFVSFNCLTNEFYDYQGNYDHLFKYTVAGNINENEDLLKL